MHAPHEHNLIYSGTSDKEPFEKRTQFIMSLSIVAGPKVSFIQRFSTVINTTGTHLPMYGPNK